MQIEFGSCRRHVSCCELVLFSSKLNEIVNCSWRSAADAHKSVVYPEGAIKKEKISRTYSPCNLLCSQNTDGCANNEQ